MRRALAGFAALLVLTAVPAVALAQMGGVTGLLVRVEGDVVISRGESADLVVVVSGNAEVRGRAAAVVVLGGEARLIGARVGHVAVVRGAVYLGEGAVVEGDVWLAWARLEQAPGAEVAGRVHRGVADYGWGWLAISPLHSLGLAVVAVSLALLAVAAVPRRTLAAGAALTRQTLGAVSWGLVLFLAVPAVGALLFFTVVGLPASLVMLGLLLPLAFLAGFTVSAVRLGRWVLRSSATRPYGAAALGSLLLLVVGLVPVAGQILVLLAGMLGAGALLGTFGGGAPEKVTAPGPAGEAEEEPGTPAETGRGGPGPVEGADGARGT